MDKEKRWSARRAALAEYKESLIALIIWYRDEFHKTRNGSHDELIKEVEAATSFDDLSGVEQITDGWLD